MRLQPRSEYGAGRQAEEEGLPPEGTGEDCQVVGFAASSRHREQGPSPGPIAAWHWPREALSAGCPHPGRGTDAVFHLIILLHAFEKWKFSLSPSPRIHISYGH